ncbi:MAG: hypothetical protein GC154_13910 [bacterium]|nr:hypothetical protein [bacterium]
MSKRKQEYEEGFERLCGFMEELMRIRMLPDRGDIDAELKAIPAVRAAGVDYVLRDAAKDAFFVIVEETYRRHDDVMPEHVHFELLPSSMDEPKTLDRMLTMGLPPEEPKEESSTKPATRRKT